MSSSKVGGLLLTVVSSVASGAAPILLKDATHVEMEVCAGALLVTTFVGVTLMVWSSRDRASAGRRRGRAIAHVDGQGVSVQGEGNTVHVTHAANATPAQAPKRAALHPVITPETIEKLFDDYTAIQAGRLAKVYDGKLIRVAGSIEDMRATGRGGITLDLKRGDGLRVIHCCFGSKSTGVLEALPKGHRVVIVGAIDLSKALVTLADCDLESVVA